MPSLSASELDQFVLLKDGTFLRCTSKQKEKIGLVILMTTDFNNQKIKLDGRTFSLNEMETDPEKITYARQQKLLFETPLVHKKI